MKRIALALLVTGLGLAPALAGDDAPRACGLFCKVWRNVSGRVQRPVSAAAWDDGSMAIPTPEQEARIPRPADLVAVHGEVIRKSHAEIQREQAQMADEIRHIDALRGDLPVGGARPEPKRPRVGQAD